MQIMLETIAFTQSVHLQSDLLAFWQYDSSFVNVKCTTRHLSVLSLENAG